MTRCVSLFSHVFTWQDTLVPTQHCVHSYDWFVALISLISKPRPNSYQVRKSVWRHWKSKHRQRNCWDVIVIVTVIIRVWVWLRPWLWVWAFDFECDFIYDSDGDCESDCEIECDFGCDFDSKLWLCKYVYVASFFSSDTAHKKYNTHY